MIRTIEDLKIWANDSHRWVTQYEAEALEWVKEMVTPGSRRIILTARVHTLEKCQYQDNGFFMGLERAGRFSMEQLNPIWDELNDHYNEAITRLEDMADEE